jgi:ATP-dependent Clp protease ATP-binding subunit ClpA
VPDRNEAAHQIDEATAGKMARSGMEAARKKFTPEFINRLDKIVVFRPLGEEQLRQILDIELRHVQQRIFSSPNGMPFVFSTTAAARNHLLMEGTDAKYGARHLKRAIERLLVQPMSNLIATRQVRAGDLVRVDYDDEASTMRFAREAEGLPVHAMAEMVDPDSGTAIRMVGVGVPEPARAPAARSTRR